MYRGRLWTMRQYAGFGTAAESNRRYRYLLGQGVTGLSVAFDLPTQIGYDSDHALAAGEVGRVGVAIDSIEDMAELFDGIPLGRVSTSMTINATALILLALYAAVARRQGVPLRDLSGTVQNDILKEYIARGTYIYPPRASLRIVTDIFAFCEREMPSWNTISISGYHIREAGSTAVQEVAFTLANGCAYVEAARAAGLDVNGLGERLSFFFNSHNDFLEEIAKFRAARRLWAQLMRERFGATRLRAQQLRFHTQTAGSTLTAQQPDNNIVRVAIQALAAVLGGTQSLHCNGRDEALALPTEESAQDGAAHPADPRARERRGEHGGSPRRVLGHRGNDRCHRARRPSHPGSHRSARRNARRHRSRRHSARDPGRGLREPAGRRHRGPDRCRGQPLRERRGRGARGSRGSTRRSRRARSTVFARFARAATRRRRRPRSTRSAGSRETEATSCRS